jgi:hypothetical protein
MLAFDAVGTRWKIETNAQVSAGTREQILECVRRFDATYSRFRPDSLVAQIAAAPTGGRFEFPEDATTLFDLYDRLAAATEGAVDPLVGRQRAPRLRPDVLAHARPTDGPRPRTSHMGDRRPARRHNARHPVTARHRRRRRRQGLPRRPRLRHPRPRRSHPVRRRRRRRPPPRRAAPDPRGTRALARPATGDRRREPPRRRALRLRHQPPRLGRRTAPRHRRPNRDSGCRRDRDMGRRRKRRSRRRARGAAGEQLQRAGGRPDVAVRASAVDPLPSSARSVACRGRAPAIPSHPSTRFAPCPSSGR